MEQFQVHVFTMPSSIKLEIQISGSVVDCVNVEVPGEHVKSLTCACQLVQRIDFSRVEYLKKTTEKKRIEFKDENEMTEAEKRKTQQQKQKEEQDEKTARDIDQKGEIYVKAEWKGNGPKMPPIKSENLFKKPKVHKNRKQYTIEEE